MALTETKLRNARTAKLPAIRWSWARSAGFIVVSCGLFWIAVFALAWRYL